MGWNTTVLVMNDALPEIEADSEFGKRLADAIKAQSISERHREPHMTAVGAHNPKGGIHCNAAEVIESHHADQTTLVAVGQNRARQVTVIGRMPEPPETDEEMVELLREWLPRGYKITDCPTCGRPFDSKPARCAQCETLDNSGEVEPFGWRYVSAGTAVFSLPDGTRGEFPRKVLVCEDCFPKLKAR